MSEVIEREPYLAGHGTRKVRVISAPSNERKLCRREPSASRSPPFPRVQRNKDDARLRFASVRASVSAARGDAVGWRATIISAMAASVACIAPASAQDMPDGVRELVFTPPLDMPREDVRAANDRCLTEAWGAHERATSATAVPYNVADGSAGIGGVIGYGIVAGISQDIAERHAYDAALAHCFNEAGYIQIGLSGRERRQWRQAALLVRQQAFAGDLLRADPSRAITPALLPERVSAMAADKDGESTPAASEVDEPAASDGKEPEAPAEVMAISATVETSGDEVAAPAQAEPVAVETSADVAVEPAQAEPVVATP